MGWRLAAAGCPMVCGHATFLEDSWSLTDPNTGESESSSAAAPTVGSHPRPASILNESIDSLSGSRQPVPPNAMRATFPRSHRPTGWSRHRRTAGVASRSERWLRWLFWTLAAVDVGRDHAGGCVNPHDVRGSRRVRLILRGES